MGRKGFKQSAEQVRDRAAKVSKALRGRKQLPEINKKRSDSLKGKIYWAKGRIGAKGPNWQGGKSTLSKLIRDIDNSTRWKLLVFDRDKFTCQGCGKHGGGELNAHHIQQFNEILGKYLISSVEEALLCKDLWDVNNGVTLCVECHKVVHKKR